ncbi:MAG: LysR family transcriptional regulator [Shewanella sp.]|nr:LysR family transcriptional regulator [Shewanella sp.]MCF1429950.1 LysR family transcriptional regulator [Shewanella sp.]MCF1439193.1 LysR family transcriptional regulator [Shewanella sp.]MCF1456157.1 LysR family transcriptional regulator [Shewanella sp.]
MYNISQSKVSRYLSGLRDLYANTLFIRKKTGFVPTTRAHQLYPVINQMVSLTENLIQQNSRDVEVKECVIAVPPTFSVGLPDYLEKTLKLIYPGLSFAVKPTRRGICEDVVKGNVSIAVTHRECTRTADCSKQGVSLITAEQVCDGGVIYVVAAESHPLWAQDELLLEDIAQYPFVVTQLPGFNDEEDPFEVFCAKQEMNLNVTQRSASLATLLESLMQSNAVSFLGTVCAAEFMNRFPGMKVMALSEAEFARLHNRVSPPKYGLICRLDRREKIPPMLITAIKSYIMEQVNAN